jgi:hypothetical protein
VLEPSATAASTSNDRDQDPAVQSGEKSDYGSTEVTLDNTEASIESTEESKTDDNIEESGAAEVVENDIIDSDSYEAVGKEEAEHDQDLLSDGEAEDATIEAPASSTAEKVTEMFQRMWNISRTSGQFVAQVQSELSTVTRELASEQGADRKVGSSLRSKMAPTTLTAVD